MQFSFEIPSSTQFGVGVSNTVGEVAKSYQLKKVLVVYDQGVKIAGIVDKVLDNIRNSNIEFVEYSEVVPNPPDTLLDEAVAFAKSHAVDGIIAVGGGSSIDAAKAINILLTNPGPIHQYDGLNLVPNATRPLIAIPTTSGTASEVTSVSVITDTERKKKMVIVGRNVGAHVALVDPELTVGLPPSITAATGLDAFTHAIESYISKLASPATEVNSLKAIELIYQNLEAAYHNGDNMEARTNMMLGSLLAGYAFNSALLGVVHAIAHPLSAHCGLPHGVANAATLAYCMKWNAEEPAVQQKFVHVAKAMGIKGASQLSDAEVVQAVVDEIARLCQAVNIPSLKELGVERDLFDTLAKATLEEIVSCMTNPREVTKDAVLNLLEQAYVGQQVTQ